MEDTNYESLYQYSQHEVERLKKFIVRHCLSDREMAILEAFMPLYDMSVLRDYRKETTEVGDGKEVTTCS